MTQAMNDSLAARVRAAPEQWFWIHNRWKPERLEAWKRARALAAVRRSGVVEAQAGKAAKNADPSA